MKLIECPRDAWQGHHPFISTDQKIEYLNLLLEVGFDTLDFGSFVSPAAMPQVSDTAEVLEGLNLHDTSTRLLSIVANVRGAQQACAFEQIQYIGFPFSISETFQLRNTNSTIAQSVERVREIQSLCQAYGKELVAYLSMGFGNPYSDPWSPALARQWVDELAGMGVRIFSLSDTVGVAKPEDVYAIFQELISTRPTLEFGGHFHTLPQEWRFKVEAAYEAGCRRFDGALLGFGGCPMAQDSLVGNMPTERLIEFGQEKQQQQTLNLEKLNEATILFKKIIG
ncbi:hydroxymethylglutaryl-CoA lyase [Arundinibacter roseus]|uniref:Hydroxymethylglutaryl-CoA lyase n=1 Tax=Arundinibacter roseus TaxID=2070510 RepID=A0A4V6P8M1_9BACT|nr:hydroxymethylglutaryl-CoA lyase [Arundinibacter roseus]TDB64105.1 hydroxymethylglutaryl-CoA lyase [Arundinibacter roseus]